MNRIELRGNEYFLNGKKLKYLKSISMKRLLKKNQKSRLLLKLLSRGKILINEISNNVSRNIN